MPTGLPHTSLLIKKWPVVDDTPWEELKNSRVVPIPPYTQLDEREEVPGGRTQYMLLQYPLRACAGESDEGQCAQWVGTRRFSGGITGTFAVASANGKQISISRQRLPITPTVTDYRAQAQTVEYCVADIGSPPSSRGHFCMISTNDCLRGIQRNTCEKRTFGSKGSGTQIVTSAT